MTPERLFSELLSVIRTTDPGELPQPLTLRAIQHSLIPYQNVRDALELDCSEDYEMLLLRLCAGDGGFFNIDDVGAHEAFRQEIGEINPDLEILEKHGTVAVHLNIDTADRLAGESARKAEAYRPPGERGHATEPRKRGATVIAFTPPDDPPDLPAPPPIPEPTPLGHTVPDPAPDITFDIAPDDRDQPVVAGDEPSAGCTACGGDLPTHRRVSFCPHCGRSQDTGCCPGCGAEIEAGWRHCIECGRSTS